MTFRVATLNLYQGFGQWQNRRELILGQMEELAPDVFGLNEISVPMQTGRWLQQSAYERFGARYSLIQQSRVNSLSREEAQGLLTRFPVIESANLDFQSRDRIAQVVRLEIEGNLVDVYVTHLHNIRKEDGLRVYQVQQLLEWVESREDADARIACGDFNATPDDISIQTMVASFRTVMTKPTAPTALNTGFDMDADPNRPGGSRSETLSMCVDYIWTSGPLTVVEAGNCFDRPHPGDPTLWPSDHIGVWADLEFEG